MRITAEQAADALITLANQHGIDTSGLDRAAIMADFTEVFARKAREAEPTPEQIALAVAPDFDELIRRGEV